jgi:tRNA threonylcarbamoyladenosine biosynthesis protein TsaE
MNADTTYTTSTNSPDESSALAKRLAGQLKGGEIIELSSDLGGGKTHFVRAIAHELGYVGEVASPTFTISRIYKLPHGLELHHFDFYRASEGELVAQELAEISGDPRIITAIEWAGQIGDSLPKDRLRIDIETSGETSRNFRFEALGPKYQPNIRGLQA